MDGEVLDRPLLPVLHIPAGAWPDLSLASVAPDIVALGVLDGLVLRESVAPAGATLSGPGDLLEPWTDRPDLRWTACQPVRLAVIGRLELAAVSGWPEVVGHLLARVLHQEARYVDALAVSGHRSDDARLIGRLRQLAARWGEPGAAGTTIPLPISVELLGRLAGVAPGSAPTLLHRLGERGLVLQRRDGTWLLRADQGVSAHRPAARPRERERTRDSLMDAFARASDAHIEALATSRRLADAFAATTSGQPPVRADGRSA